MTDVHEFELAGLGKAPFSFVALDEKSDGCHFCAHSIIWRCHIVSADNKHFHVGTDCVAKTGDKGLINTVKAEQRRVRREKAQAKREQGRLAMLQAERDRNGGLTDWEFTEKRHADNHAIWLAKTVAPRAVLSVFADKLDDGKGGFCTDIARQLRAGDVISGRALHIAKEIVAKQSGRKNSKAFDAAFDRIEETIDPALAALEGVACA
jgi:hypothetical protein